LWSSWDVLGNKLILIAVGLITLPHLTVLETTQFVNIASPHQSITFIVFNPCLWHLMDVRGFLLRLIRVWSYKGYFDVVRC
jgi:hypothetical protein